MQFREVGRRVQCLASQYDPQAKRTRQRMVFSLRRFGPVSRPTPADLRIGDEAQRRRWADEIARFLELKAEKEAAEDAAMLPVRLRLLVDRVVHCHKNQPAKMTDDIRKRLAAELRRLGPVVGIKMTKGRVAMGSRSFGPALVARAKKLRNQGKTFDEIAYIMTSKGTKVSRSWAQKHCSREMY